MSRHLFFIKSISFSILFACCLLLAVTTSSCKKEKLDTQSGISFSTDTLTFDTIFTTLGSTTRFFVVRNTQKQPIKISNIKLAGGAASSYRINVDGDAGISFNDIEIPAKDSIYIFAEVTVNPNAANLPFIIEDSLQFITNGKLQQVQLNAYGQNAHFFNADSIELNTTWTNDLPYVILNYLQIKQSACLTIQKGCKVHFGGGAAMIVEGCLNIDGEDTTNAVVFRGVRLDKDVADRPYDNFPGQYAGVFFLRNSTGNINFLKMRNSSYGINVGNVKTTDDNAANIAALQAMNRTNAPQVTIRNSFIYNAAFYGLFGFNGFIRAQNVLIYNCGKNNVALIDGGDYEFVNCTFYNRGSAYTSHTKEPVFYMNNYFDYGGAQPIMADTAIALFNNCIVYGTLEKEIIAEDLSANTHRIITAFRNCVLKTNDALNNPPFIVCKTDDPQFEDALKSDFRLKSGSPCIDFSVIPATPTDIVSKPITGLRRDCGAYEYQ